jgi:hypothetical protein
MQQIICENPHVHSSFSLLQEQQKNTVENHSHRQFVDIPPDTHHRMERTCVLSFGVNRPTINKDV